MNIIEALNSRHSVRAFNPDPVDRGTLERIMRAANLAPSWGNSQPWEIFVAGGGSLAGLRQAFLKRYDEGLPMQPELPRPREWPPALRQRMAENRARRFTAMGWSFDDQEAKRASGRLNYEFFGAPVVVYLCLDRTLTAWSIFDLGMLAMNIMLAAREFGVDSIPALNLVAYPDLIRSQLGISENLMILMGLALGHRDPEHPLNKFRSLRRRVEDVVRFNGV